MTIETSKIQVHLEGADGCRRRVSVKVPASVVDAEREEIARSLATRMKLPGFRKGQVPAGMVEKRYGPTLRRETLDRVIGTAYRVALERESLQPISEGEVDDVEYEAGSDLSFTASFEVRPEVELSRLGGFRVERPPLDVGEEELEKVLERLREQESVWTPVEAGTPEDGDTVSVEIVRLEEGEEGEPTPYEFVLGRDEAIPDVENAIRTLEPGESGEFTVAFPDDFPDEERRGEEQRLRIELHSRKAMELPELDDDFARTVGDFEDLADLTEKIREDLEKEAREQQESAVRGQLLANLLEANPFDVPDAMVERYMASVFGDTEGVDPGKLEEARQEFRPEARRAVQRVLVVERIAETQNLAATEDEVDARIEEIAERSGASASEVYARLQKAGRLESLEREITERKVFEFLKQKSEIVDVPA